MEAKFAPYLSQMKWLNVGGGHHVTREDCNWNALTVRAPYERNLRPGNLSGAGRAIRLKNAGYLVTEVMDVVENGIKILILDASAACHMPDVLEMPYRPPLKDSGLPGEKEYTYRLSSCTCLAGDVIGDYSFDREITRETGCILRIWRFIPW